MRRFPIVLTGVIVVLLVQTTYAAKPWLTNFEKARAEAKRRNLPLLIHFYADWCGPCQEMEQKVLSSSSLAKGVKGRFIAVKVDTDDREDLVDRYHIEALPSDLILSPQGKILSRSAGYTGRSSYLAKLDRVETKWARTQPRQPATTQVVKKEVPKPIPTEPRVQVASQQRPKPVVPEKKREVIPEKVKRAVVGIDGYCPVSLYDTRNWKEGDARYAWEYKGFVYHMSGAAALKKFQTNSKKYAPRLLGCDPVTLHETDRAIPGSIQYGAFYDNELFLFLSAKSRTKFRGNPPRYNRIRHALKIEHIEQARVDGSERR